jgi:hypothetical protein
MEESQAEAQARARASGRRGSFGARPRPLEHQRSQRFDASTKTINLSEGDFFGERSLLTDEPSKI